MHLRNIGFGVLMASAIGLSLLNRTADAAVVHLNTSDTAVFSFDATGLLTPPITSLGITVNFGADPLNGGETIQISFFDELSGPSLHSFTLTEALSGASALGLPPAPLTPAIADDTGFVTITAIGGSFDISSVIVGENLVGVGTQFVGINPAPEPTSLALFAIGLAGLGFSRRKRTAT